MKKIIIMISCLLPFMSIANTTNQHHTRLAYLELCAKEHDPVKRQNYCRLLEKEGQIAPSLNVFRKDTVVV